MEVTALRGVTGATLRSWSVAGIATQAAHHHEMPFGLAASAQIPRDQTPPSAFFNKLVARGFGSSQLG